MENPFDVSEIHAMVNGNLRDQDIVEIVENA